MFPALQNIITRVTELATAYQEAVEQNANAAAEAAEAQAVADTAAAESTEARQAEADTLDALRQAVDELDELIAPKIEAKKPRPGLRKP